MDDADLLMNLARTRSKELVASPETRRFIEKPLAREYPEAYHRLVEIELMARGAFPDGSSDYVLELWLEAQERLEGLLERRETPEELMTEATTEGNKNLRSDLFVWSLLDKSRGMLPANKQAMVLLEVAEAAVLVRLAEENNPEGKRRSDGTTDLYWMCRAQRGNLIRVRGDVQGGFEVVRKSGTLVRPWGHPYLAGRVLSYYSSAAIDAGHFDLAQDKAKKTHEAFRRVKFLHGMGATLNLDYHINLLNGVSSRDLLANFLTVHNSLPKQLLILTKINLLGSLVYFHDADGAEETIADLERFDLDSVESLWLQHYKAIILLKSGKPELAVAKLGAVATAFVKLGLTNQGHFVALFEVLGLLDLGHIEHASRKVRTPAEFFLSIQLYGGLLGKTAGRLLVEIQRKAVDRHLVLSLIDAFLSPAKKGLGGASSGSSR